MLGEQETLLTLPRSESYFCLCIARTCMSGIEEPADAGMPLFKWSKGSGDVRTKLERKLYLAQENPEPVFDLSECSLSDVPSGVFSKCRVFRKTTLLLHDNKLSSINGGGLLKDLGEIIVLDLHANKLSSLPDDFGLLKCLSVLDLGGNALKKLPGSFAMLLLLESLNLSENKFKDFPSPVVKLRRLQKLNVSRNAISKLPVDFHELKLFAGAKLWTTEKYTFSSS
uniref:Putative ubiquitin ligase protein lrsam1 n=1 Tax=Ixodes ricinus TaxID=34613 RepID=A0A0K8RFZ4_IXORI